MKNKAQELTDLISAALESIGGEYYKIATTYKPMGVVRERVFCYELYHQMRLIQDERELHGIQIYGEIDKNGHHMFDEDARRNPDFVFHVPGIMEENMFVVEVKGNIGGNRNDVYKDVETLSKFTRERHNYQLGVLIIYNYSADEFRLQVCESIKNKVFANKIPTDKIVVLCKKSKGSPVEYEKLDDLLER